MKIREAVHKVRTFAYKKKNEVIETAHLLVFFYMNPVKLHIFPSKCKISRIQLFL